MIRLVTSVLVSIVCIGGAVHHFFSHQGTVEASAVAAPSVLDFKMKDIDGNEVKLKKYKGSVLLIVNTASKCGYTPQYEGLQAVYQKYQAQGFYVLGFPANNFGGQEPGNAAQIKEFCESKYKVTFPMFAKISVKGDDQDPLYNFLTNKETNPEFGGDITWNFNKFLVDRKGKVVGRFTSKDTPESESVTAAIEKYIAAK
ncbi:MAG: glutathione peroxidase [Acidobacteriota bacterium]